MNLRVPAFAVIAGIVALFPLVSAPLRAQVPGVTVAGAITDSSGRAVPNAKVSVKNVTTGQSTDTRTDSTGFYSVPDQMPGDFEVSVSAEGFNTKMTKVSLAASAKQSLDVALSAEQMQQQTQGNKPTPESPQNPVNAPPGKSAEPTLQDLGFPAKETQGSAQDQARLDKRSHMLKIHQRLGLIATAPLIATVFTSLGAGGKKISNTDRLWHTALGSATADLYFISAFYAIRAPSIPGTKARGPIRLHKALAWIHGPGMILTPILGAIAYKQKSKGEKIHGFASAHGPVAIVTAAAYGAAIVSVSFKF
ncbi:MAG: carboxypeptidase-like regulatory domain-containing protein [Candidatus Acidiferrales bacterium]